MIITKGKQKYLKIGTRAIPFDDVDENGRPVIKPKIKRSKVNGKDKLTITIPALRINYKVNGKRNIPKAIRQSDE